MGLAVAGLFAADYFYQFHKLQSRLDSIRARSEPVTLEELNNWHEPVADDQNVCLAIEKANELWVEAPQDDILQLEFHPATQGGDVIGEWWNGQVPYNVSQYLESNVQFTEAVHSALQLSGSRSRVTYGRDESHTSSNLRATQTSRSRIAYDLDESLESHDAVSVFDRAKHVLMYKAVSASTIGDGEIAVDAIVDLLKICRALDLEPNPTVVSQNRLSVIETCVMVSFTLSRCELSAKSAQNLQSALANYADSIDFSRIVEMVRCAAFCRAQSQMQESLYFRLLWPRSANRILNGFETYEKAMELPPPEYVREWKTLLNRTAPRFGSSSDLLNRILDDVQQTPDIAALEQLQLTIIAQRTDDPNISTAIAATAVHRYRMDNSLVIPESLNKLVPRYLTSVPINWYDGQPLQIRTCRDGYIVYTTAIRGYDSVVTTSNDEIAAMRENEIDPGCSEGPIGQNLFRVILSRPPLSNSP